MKKLPLYALLLLLGMVSGRPGANPAEAAGKETASGAAQTTQAVAHAAVQYVSAAGRDSNDGLSWGAAKASIQAAIRALPACSYGPHSWGNCGQIKLGAGIHTISSPIVVSSPFVSISGRSPVATRISYTGKSGCAIEWTAGNSVNLFPGNPNTVNLKDITINGSSAGPGTCGLETYDIDSFTAHNVAINNFSKTGSIGWWDTNVNWFSERFDVQMMLGNDAIGWKIERRHTAKYANTTFGYGNFRLWINPSANGTAVACSSDDSGHAFVQFSRMYIIINGVSPSTAFSFTDHCLWQYDSGNIHAEDVSTMWNIDATSGMQWWMGPINWPNGTADNRIDGELTTLSTWSYRRGTGGVRFQIKHKGFARNSLLIGDASNADANSPGDLAIAQPSEAGENPLVISKAGRPRFYVDTGGDLHTATAGCVTGGSFCGYLLSAGRVTLSSGSGSHTFTKPYGVVPVCTATDETAPNAVHVWVSKRQISVTGVGSDVVSWICTPTAN